MGSRFHPQGAGGPAHRLPSPPPVTVKPGIPEKSAGGDAAGTQRRHASAQKTRQRGSGSDDQKPGSSGAGSLVEVGGWGAVPGPIVPPGLHSALQKSRTLLPSDAHSSSPPPPPRTARRPPPPSIYLNFVSGVGCGGARGEGGDFLMRECLLPWSRQPGDSLPALSLSGAPAHRAALPSSSRFPARVISQPPLSRPPRGAVARRPSLPHPPIPGRTHLAAPRSRRHARTGHRNALGHVHALLQARCRIQRRALVTVQPSRESWSSASCRALWSSRPSAAASAAAAAAFLRRRCRCAPGLQTASWASPRPCAPRPRRPWARRREASATKAAGNRSGQGRGGRPASQIAVALPSAPGGGSFLAVRAGQWLWSRRLGPHPRSAGGVAELERQPRVPPERPAGWPQCRARSEQASDSSAMSPSPRLLHSLLLLARLPLTSFFLSFSPLD